ncbi:MAG: hypothetical protein AB1610_01500 [Nitrospirota bacterium]
MKKIFYISMVIGGLMVIASLIVPLPASPESGRLKGQILQTQNKTINRIQNHERVRNRYETKQAINCSGNATKCRNAKSSNNATKRTVEGQKGKTGNNTSSQQE